MLVLDHVQFFDLFLLDVDFIEVFFFIELENFDAVLNGFDIFLGVEEVFDGPKGGLLGGFRN